MVYNFNLGIGWASSGVEYAQAYRAKMLRKIGAETKFVFTDMFIHENIEHMTKNIGFLDSEVIWLYTYFTDFETEPVIYSVKDLEKTFPSDEYTFSRDKKIGKYVFQDNTFWTVYFVNETTDLVHRVEIVSRGFLIRKDFFTSGRVFSEYYAPKDNKAHLYLRRFFNRDGSFVYDEIIEDDRIMYKFKNKILCSKEEFVGYMVSKLGLTKDDMVIVDRTTGIGQSIFMNAGDAKLAIVIHADHFSEGNTDNDYILWNNYYEYDFAMNKHISVYIASTDEQTKLVKQQFEKYMNVSPEVVTIPVGGLEKLRFPKAYRKPASIITASRLASEKHVDWCIEAVVKAHQVIPEITFDIYGKGGEEEKLLKLIKDKNADTYIRLCGQQNLEDVYQNYEMYLAGSTSEGFGLSLMEAIGGGLSMVGFNVRYGNPTFIDENQNGYLINIDDGMSSAQKIDELSKRIIKYFTEADKDAFHAHSYTIGERYLETEVQKLWKELVF